MDVAQGCWVSPVRRGRRRTRDPARLLGLAPEFFEASIPAAAMPVEFISNRILLVVVLMIFLCRVECRSRNNLGGNLLESLGVDQGLLGLFGQAPLLVIVIEDGRPVLIASITELAPPISRIDIPPEDLEHFIVTDPLGIVDDLNRLSVAGGAG